MLLTDMETGQSGKIVAVLGGYILTTRLDSLGIRKGQKITKISSSLMRGPVVIQVGTMQTAIGFGMAHKIEVEISPYSSME